MNLRKRTLALLLTVCMLLSVAVPMVSAASTPVSKQLLYKNYQDNFEKVAQSGSRTIGVTKATSSMQIKFTEEDYNNGSWVAIRVTLPDEMKTMLQGLCGFRFMTYKLASGGGKADFYVLPDDTTKTGDALVSYIDTLIEDDTYFKGAIETNTANTWYSWSHNVDGDSLLLVFKCTGSINNGYYTYFDRITFIPPQQPDSPETLETALANIGTFYGSVKLVGDINADGVTIPANVTLDLNGHTLSGTGITLEGKLADSSNGDGLLKIAYAENNVPASDDLVLYDSQNEGYRVYNDYTVAPHGTELQDMGNGAKRLWIKLTFANKDAYRVIATGNSGIEIGAALNWAPAEGTPVNTTLSFQNSHEQDWGTKMQTAETYGFYIEFTGFDALAAGTLTLTPVVNGVSSANSVVFSK